MSEALSVYWGPRLTGRLWRDEKSSLRFQYDPAWLASKGASPLSLRLPLQKEPFDPDHARPFFANLLPEANVRARIARGLGVSESNDFQLLEELGGDCAGALTLLPEGAALQTQGEYQLVSSDELARMIEEMPQRPLLTAQEGLRLSLAGAQEKIPVYLKDGQIFLPRGSNASSHILKPAMTRFANTVQNEAFCMMLAADSGLPVPKAVIREGRQRAYLIERYDRRLAPDGKLLRIHQEDFCQALGVDFSRKYEAEGGPGLKDCFALLDKHSSEPILDKRNMLKAVVFNYLIGNCDAHAKNFSLLLDDDAVRLTPFYDLVSTKVYGTLSPKFAMRIGGQLRGEWVTKENWLKLADEAAVGSKAVLSICEELGETVPVAADKLAEQFLPKYGGEEIVRQVIEHIGTMSKSMLERLK
ncbi:MAG: protein HipA [Elusimicrobia bacterium CG11_big_fil_rev_8_21_14_0_20_64_6]|nr:MAG: protein HipA [Elusimicrobia bacterium CG11_big_fil_rev_8_21_14_0_20_64_6]